ncbi:MAG TPA: translation initiation factor IF-2 [Kofleriaceae bacterium]|jgi:translation initiation factor IF-2|nr:translation initiation factor IF-2 [Kofleriaceae bacterium]
MERAVGKIRIYEIARQLGMTSDEVRDKLRARGEPVTSASSTVHAAVAEALVAKIRAERSPSPAPAVAVRRRPITAPAAGPRSAAPAPASPGELPLELLDVRARYERALAAARARAEQQRRDSAPPAPTQPVRVQRVEIDLQRDRRIRVPRGPGISASRPGSAPRRPGPPAPRPPARPGARPGVPPSRRPATPSTAPKSAPVAPPATAAARPAPHRRVIEIEGVASVHELARAMGVKVADLLPRLWRLGLTTATVNTVLDDDAAALLAGELDYEVRNTAFSEQAALAAAPDRAEDLVPRAPVVTVMGHVDHGKTSLLDAIRRTHVAAGEQGGITQHVAAWRVETSAGPIVFIDTPGHEAFAAMRARGARATDLVVLAVAADDGVKPQTLEALDHARHAGVPIVVAVTKLDLPAARPDFVRTQLAEHGLIPEAWGGHTQYVDVSARTGEGIAQLLAAIAAQAAMLDLRANPRRPAVGVVLEARVDRGRGPIASVVVQTGTLHRGDTVVCGERVGRVRVLLGGDGRAIEAAGPAMPVEVIGLDGAPAAGDPLHATDDVTARRIAAHRRDQRKHKELAVPARLGADRVRDQFRAAEQRRLRVIVKADTQGTAEALRDALGRLASGEVGREIGAEIGAEIGVDVVRAAVGPVTESDVHLAIASGARILGFGVGTVGHAAALARHEAVAIERHDVIYDAVDAVRAALTGLLPAVERVHELGVLEVRQVFRIPRIGTIAGCRVIRGRIRRDARVRVVRTGAVVHDGRLASLRRFEDDVAEVAQGLDCGVAIAGFDAVRVGDAIEAYEVTIERQARAA